MSLELIVRDEWIKQVIYNIVFSHKWQSFSRAQMKLRRNKKSFLELQRFAAVCHFPAYKPKVLLL